MIWVVEQVRTLVGSGTIYMSELLRDDRIESSRKRKWTEVVGGMLAGE